MTIVTECPLCGQQHAIEVSDMGLIAYNRGALIQDAFPDLTKEEREMLMTGICPECWIELFEDKEEDGKEEEEQDAGEKM